LTEKEKTAFRWILLFGSRFRLFKLKAPAVIAGALNLEFR
jgi:hypothetical protein